MLLDAFRMNSRKVIGRNPSMVIPLLANQDLTPMLSSTRPLIKWFLIKNRVGEISRVFMNQQCFGS